MASRRISTVVLIPKSRIVTYMCSFRPISMAVVLFDFGMNIGTVKADINSWWVRK
jgi:hypothetical protein